MREKIKKMRNSSKDQSLYFFLLIDLFGGNCGYSLSGLVFLLFFSFFYSNKAFQSTESTMTSLNNPVLAATSSESGKVISHFKIGMEIGRGSFANVYKGADLNNNKTVAIKSVFRSRLKNQKLITNLEVEIKILRNLKNPHIVSLLDCVKTDTYFHLIMDYCSLGDLSSFIKKKSQLADFHPIVKTVMEKYPSPAGSDGLNEILVINFIKQLATALKFLRSQNLIHRDIKPQNLLLCTPAHSKEQFVENKYSGFWELPILKVADFGFARYLPSTSMAETLCGSPLYMAPEILRYEKYNAKADLWSVGAVIYEMTVGKPPFRASNHIELLKKIEKGNDEINFPNHFEISQDLIRLICNLLKANPIDRMGFNEFFQDPIIISNNDLIKSVDEEMNYSFECEEMYVSEFLVGKENFEKNNAKRIELNNQKIKKNDINNNEKQSVIPLNKLVIEEEDEEENTSKETSVEQTENYRSNGLKSSVSNGIVTKETINEFKPNINQMDQSIEKLLQKQQQQKQRRNSRKKNDLIVEKDYVVIEKRNVEVNSFADEVMRPLERRLSIKSKNSNAVGGGQRKHSISVSPTNALKDVIDYTSKKLFGTTTTNVPIKSRKVGNYNGERNIEDIRKKVKEDEVDKVDEVDDVNDKKDINEILQIPNQNDRTIKIDKTEQDIIYKIERLAMMAHSIGIYAMIKFNQVIPLPPSNTNEIKNIIEPFEYKNENDTEGDIEGIIDNFQYNLVYKGICEEGLVLYLKVLSILGDAIKISNEWWNKNKFKSEIIPKMGELIQWIRNKFNECLEKAEYLKLRINRFEEEIGNEGDINYEKEDFICEKIIFDRAIEISKETAIMELKYTTAKGNTTNVNIKELEKCELAYSLSVWMLETLLYKSEYDDKEDDSDALTIDDQHTIENFLNSIGTRLLVLKDRIKK